MQFLNIVDGSNLERNLYLTTQLLEMGIPMVIAINMMDVVVSEAMKFMLISSQMNLAVMLSRFLLLRMKVLMRLLTASNPLVQHLCQSQSPSLLL